MSRIFPKSQKRQILEIFCKICFPYFARDKWSDHDSENCSEIRPVTRIRNLWRQSQILRKWPKIRAFQGSKSDSAFCKIRLPNFARDESSNHDFENCSKISSVTWFRICPGLLHFPTFLFFTPPYWLTVNWPCFCFCFLEAGHSTWSMIYSRGWQFHHRSDLGIIVTTKRRFASVEDFKDFRCGSISRS